jgi:AraC family transcriptional regulator of adaptative response / DNA-3-methyladenine glycosylase II
VPATFTLADARDLAPALERTRRLLDADCDPLAVAETLGADPTLATLVARRPGLRVPGHVDGVEVAVRAVLGQQVTVAAARTLAARLVAAYGDPLVLDGDHTVTQLFPTAAAIAAADPDGLAMPQSRKRALRGLAQALADGDVVLDRSRDRGKVRADLLALPGIGPWTADYIALRALGDPDVFLPTDTGVRDAARLAGLDDVAATSEAWRPWRSYALMHLWTSLTSPPSSRHPNTDTEGELQ